MTASAVPLQSSLSAPYAISFRPFRDLLMYCPACLARGKKHIIARQNARAWACCGECGFRVGPGPASDEQIPCPRCSPFTGSTISRFTRQAWGCCPRCGHRIHPGVFVPPDSDEIQKLRKDKDHLKKALISSSVAATLPIPADSAVNKPTVEAISATTEKPFGQLGMRLRKSERRKFTNSAKVPD